MVLEVQNDDFALFFHAREAALRKCSDPYKTVAGATKIKVFCTPSALHVSRKTMKNRSKGLSNKASHKDRAKNQSESSPGSALNGSGALLGDSGPVFGCSWASLGPSWPLLGLS